MADVKLSATLEANVNQFIGNFNKAAGVVQSFEGAAIGSVTAVNKSFTLLNNTKFTFGANFATASNVLANQASKTASILGGSMVKGSNSAAFALTNLGRVAQDAPFGFIGIQNNLNPLLESFQRLKSETGSTGTALKALGSSLIGPAGLGIALSLISSAVLFYQQYQQRTNKTVTDAKKSTEEYANSLGQVEKASLLGARSAAQETTTLSLLYKQYTNGKLTLEQRKSAYDQIQTLYPAYFGNIKFEQEASVKTKDAYDRLTTSIIATARARAAGDLITKNSQRILENEQKLIDLGIAGEKSRAEVKKATQALKGTGATGELGEARATADFTNALREQSIIQKQITDTVTDSVKLRDKNLQLEKSVTAEIQKGGLLTGAVGAAIDPIQNIRENLIKGRKGLQTDLNSISDEISKTPLLPVESFKIQSKDFLSALEIFESDLNRLADGAIDNSLMGFGSAIGEAMATGGSAFEAGGRALLGSFGGFLSEYGKLLIKYGAAAVLKGKLDLAALIPGAGIPAGIAAIAAGVALVAAGAAVSSFAGGGKNSQSDGAPSKARKIPGFASGIEAGRFGGGIALVGEKGPEIVNLPTGAGVIPNHRIGSAMGGGQFNLVGDLKISMRQLYLELRREESLQFRTG